MLIRLRELKPQEISNMSRKRIKITKSKGIDRYDGEYELKVSRIRRNYVVIPLNLTDLYTLQKRVDKILKSVSHENN